MPTAPRDLLIRYDAASRLEWLQTDGVGGVAASSLPGANTRKQHALLATEFDGSSRSVLIANMLETLVDGQRLRLQALPSL